MITAQLQHQHQTSSCRADMSELNLPKRANIAFPDGKDKLLHFQITMRPEEGIYRCVWNDFCWRRSCR